MGSINEASRTSRYLGLNTICCCIRHQLWLIKRRQAAFPRSRAPAKHRGHDAPDASRSRPGSLHSKAPSAIASLPNDPQQRSSRERVAIPTKSPSGRRSLVGSTATNGQATFQRHDPRGEIPDRCSRPPGGDPAHRPCDTTFPNGVNRRDMSSPLEAPRPPDSGAEMPHSGPPRCKGYGPSSRIGSNANARFNPTPPAWPVAKNRPGGGGQRPLLDTGNPRVLPGVGEFVATNACACRKDDA